MSNESSPYLDIRFLRSLYTSFYSPVSIGCRAAHVLLLTDSANSFSASHQCNLRTSDRSTRLHLSYIRDLLNVVGFSYATYAFDVADFCTKENGNLDIRRGQIEQNMLQLGFLTRTKFKTMVLLMKTAERRSSC